MELKNNKVEMVFEVFIVSVTNAKINSAAALGWNHMVVMSEESGVQVG